jgi:hypothetical protein
LAAIAPRGVVALLLAFYKVNHGQPTVNKRSTNGQPNGQPNDLIGPGRTEAI